MRISLLPPRWLGLAMVALLNSLASEAQLERAANHAANRSGRFSWDQLEAVASKQYQGNDLSVTAIPEGAELRCTSQRLEGQVTSDGSWLTSTAEGATGKRFRITAVEIGREGAESQVWPWRLGERSLARTGEVVLADRFARFIRPGLTEEYSVSVDGVRQDFVITERPAGATGLLVELVLTGARAEVAAYGARLTLVGSGRELAYSRLRVADASGQELTAHLEVLSADRLAVRVADANATYPVRIDPTFSDADWVSLNPGMPGADGTVNAMVVDSSGNVYVGGDFTFIGTVPANGIAKWDGNVWSTLGSGMNSSVRALAVSGDALYVGGDFTTAGGVPASRVAKWNGSVWSALGLGVSSSVRALAVSGTDLYAGGRFSKAGGVTVNRIAKWDGSGWSALGSGMSGSGSGTSVQALAVNGTDLWAGGDFTTAGGVSANYIAKWDGSGWSAMGSGMSAMAFRPMVLALAVSGTNLYAGGYFDWAGGVYAPGIARWDGIAWSTLGLGKSLAVAALAVSGTNLYVAAKEGTSVGIAKWDGRAWSALGSGMNNEVYALALSGTDLFAGGLFTTAGSFVADHIAKWDGSAWSALGAGVNGEVFALAVRGTDLYAGGTFTTAGGVVANGIGKWDGRSWSALGVGMILYGYARALALSGPDLYAGGDFLTAGGMTVNYIAKWSGNNWLPLGSGMDGGVNALAVSGTDIYAGGRFSKAGGTAASNVAQWSGGTWSSLGPGLDGNVSALAVSGANVYAGGYFTNAGGITVNHIARWDGNRWSALGSGTDGVVYALAVSGTDLYAGGYFSTAGGVPASGIAKWNGSVWSALGSGMSQYNSVIALAVSGTSLYAGGQFTTAGSVAASGIAQWDGSNWSALGSGVSQYANVQALAADGAGHLFVGGRFYLAGANVSPFVAQANVGTSVAGGRFVNLTHSPVAGFGCIFGDATPGQPYRIQVSPSLAAGSWTDLTNFTYTGSTAVTDASAVAAPKKYYRAVAP